MKKMLKILRKYIWEIILVIILLVVQAYCDLALPDYTSSIINIGIQEGGIERTLPEKVSEKELNKILLFVKNENKEFILSKYELSEKIYKLRDITNEEKDEIENIMTLPMAMTYYLGKMKIEELVNSIPIETNKNNKEDTNYLEIIKNLPEDADVFTIIATLDEETIQKISQKFEEQYVSIGESMIEQSAKAYLKEEYKNVGIDVEGLQIQYIAKTGAKMIALAALIMIITIVTTLLASRISANFTADLRRAMVNKVMSFSNAELVEISTASLITRCTNDIQQVQIALIMLLRMILYAPIIGIGALTKLWGHSLGGVVAVAIAVIIGVIILLLIIAMPKFKRIQDLIDRLNMVAREILTGLPVIRAFATEKHEEKRFDKANDDLTKNQLFTRKIMSLLSPFLTLLMNGTSIAIIWFASKQINLGTMQVGDMTAILTYTIQIIMAFLMISMVSIMGPRAMISVKRVNEVLNKEVSIKNKNELKKFGSKEKGVIEFRDVSFKYPDGDECVLEHINFKAMPGTTTAFIGSTGSGKSTLINLIPRFYDVTEGQILIDGIDVRDVSLKDLRDKIGIVPQKGLLFSGTIESNIKFGNENLDEEGMIKAAKISCAQSFIEEKDEKYLSEISQGGTNVSGGQRQRLAIARAIATSPDIYIFDDSFSALDYKTDSMVRKNLAEETKDSTILIVAQRISTIMNADNIIVLNEGKIVGMGTHKELLESCETYQEIASSQLSQKEIEETKSGKNKVSENKAEENKAEENKTEENKIEENTKIKGGENNG